TGETGEVSPGSERHLTHELRRSRASTSTAIVLGTARVHDAASKRKGRFPGPAPVQHATAQTAQIAHTALVNNNTSALRPGLDGRTWDRTAGSRVRSSSTLGRFRRVR